MPDVGSELVAFVRIYFSIPSYHVTDQSAQLDDEFRYLQKKKKVVQELAENRLKVRYSDCH
jgi:hypothetical protein